MVDYPDVSVKIVSDTDLDLSEICHLLYIAKKYDVIWIKCICQEAISDWMKVDNVLFIYENLRGLDEEELKKKTFITESVF